MKFIKPPISIDEQIILLKKRGMLIHDYDRAVHYLKHISYYRLRAYWLPFEIKCDVPDEHAFKEGTSFEDVVDLYVFDRELRLLIMDAVERIEVSVRASWAYYLATTYGAHGYLDRNLYAKPTHYDEACSLLINEIKRSKDTFIEHYKNKYGDPTEPPIWMTAEVISLGQLSKWIANLKFRKDRKLIAENFKLDEKVYVSIIHHLAYIRNICAHHGRLWNKIFTVTMTIPNYPDYLNISMNSKNLKNIYNTLCIINYLLKITSPNTQWKNKLYELLGRSNVDLKPMGFPDDWKTFPIWKIDM